LVGVLARFASMQLVVQAVSAVVGIAIVRSLTRQDYAAYSLAMAVITGCGVVAHSGFSSTVLSRGAQVRSDRASLSRLMATAAHYRRRVTVLMVAVGMATLMALLRRIGIPLADALVLVAVTGVAVMLSAMVAVRTELLALEYRRGQMQRLSLVLVATRLTGQALLAWTRSASSLTTTAVHCAGLLVVGALQRRTVRDIVDLSVDVDQRELANVRRSFRMLLPGNVLLVVQGQLVLLLLAILGHGGPVADLGAVMRYAVVLGVIGATVNGVLVPLVARSAREHVARAYLLVCGVVSAMGALGVIAVFTATGPLLAILGAEYSDLQTALRITFCGAAVAALTDAMSSLNQARGWLKCAWVQVPGVLVTVGIVMIFVDVSTATGAAILSAALVIPGLVTQTLQLLYGRLTLEAPSPGARELETV
jgi:O-antigen/teichoic acid export membrane protein